MINLLNFLPVYFDKAEMFSKYNIFIIAIAIFWLVIASVQDFKRREVENWWNFSLIAIILAFRAFVSAVEWNIWYFAWGLIGLLAGFIVMNLFYYARMFGGGDAKMLMALGVVLPLSLEWIVNLEILILFLFIFLVAGALYGACYSLVVMLGNFRAFLKEFLKIFKKYRKILFLVEIVGVLGFIFSFAYKFDIGSYLMALVFASPWLLVWAKAIEESCMKRFVSAVDLTVGDWLADTLTIGKKKITPNWEGLSESELSLIQKKYKRKVLIKYGAPFIPAFLITLLALILGIYFGAF